MTPGRCVVITGYASVGEFQETTPAPSTDVAHRTSYIRQSYNAVVLSMLGQPSSARRQHNPVHVYKYKNVRRCICKIYDRYDNM